MHPSNHQRLLDRPNCGKCAMREQPMKSECDSESGCEHHHQKHHPGVRRHSIEECNDRRNGSSDQRERGSIDKDRLELPGNPGALRHCRRFTVLA
jgi:hypothetical protein